MMRKEAVVNDHHHIVARPDQATLEKLVALADAISIVKHAATGQSPVMTAEERVNHAMETLVAKHKFNTEQLQWLSLVREQLIKNLTIDEEDFDNTPLLRGRGGVARAKQVFGELDLLVAQLNEAVAA